MSAGKVGFTSKTDRDRTRNSRRVWKAGRINSAPARSEHAGRAASARGAYLRASNYWRAAWTFLLQAPIDARALDAYRRHREAFVRAAKRFASIP